MCANRLIDNFGREIDYLRISITDRCNLRCFYCMPYDGIAHKDQDRILSFEQIEKIASVAAELGICKIRITGGEPLVRKNLPLLISKLRSINGIKELALTTNGIYLNDYASLLKNAGLDRINVSLDSLIPEKFNKITRGGELKKVLRGIEAALSAGFQAIKINMVLIRDFNTDEITDFAELTRQGDIHVRFIEYMPTCLNQCQHEKLFFSAHEAKACCGKSGRLIPADKEGRSTARIFRIEGFFGTIGFIAPISEPFCQRCNKLRLTADGYLKGCLHSSRAIDLRPALINSATDKYLAYLFREAVSLKPVSHNLLKEPFSSDNSENFSMCQIGG